MTVKAIVTYLCSDGIPHSFDAANRNTPLCGADVFITGAAEGSMAPACEDCAIFVLDIVEGLA